MVNEIKDRVSLQDLFETLGIRVKGRQASCPFHEDRTPSLSFKDGLWYCFVCGVGGDIISFVMRHEHLDFKGAIAWLNETYNLGLTDKPYKKDPYLTSLTDNYLKLKSSLNEEFNRNCHRYWELIATPTILWSNSDFNFDHQYHSIMDEIEANLKALENARIKLRENFTRPKCGRGFEG